MTEFLCIKFLYKNTKINKQWEVGWKSTKGNFLQQKIYVLVLTSHIACEK